MDVVHERAAGMDISKRDAKVAVRVPGKRAGAFTTSVTTWGSTVGQILELIEFLDAQQVTTDGGDGGDERLLEALCAPRGALNRVGVKGPRRWSVAAGR